MYFKTHCHKITSRGKYSLLLTRFHQVELSYLQEIVHIFSVVLSIIVILMTHTHKKNEHFKITPFFFFLTMTILTVYFHLESRATDDSSSSSSPCLRSVFHHFPLSVVMFFLYVRSASTEDKVRYPTAKKSAYIFMKNM